LEHIHQISTEEIEQYRNHLHSIGLSNATIKHKLHPVGATIKYAKKLGYQTSEVEIPRVKVSKGRLRYLTELEEQKLLTEIDPYRHVEGMPPFKQRNGIVKQQMIDLHHLIILLLDTGARHSEICNLQWGNIDLEKKTIALWRSKVQNESVLYMTDRVVKVLSERYSKRVSNFIFTSKQGNARRTLTHVIQRAFKRAGLDGCSAHTLRHTHATRLIQNGLNLYEIKEILGHADIQTTMRYAHIEQEQVSRKAVNVINIFNTKQLTPTDLPSK
jgi:integrase